MTSKAENILTDAVSRINYLIPVSGFDHHDIAAAIIEELQSKGYVIAPRALTDEMLAAGLAAHSRALPASVMAQYSAELQAWDHD